MVHKPSYNDHHPGPTCRRCARPTRPAQQLAIATPPPVSARAVTARWAGQPLLRAGRAAERSLARSSTLNAKPAAGGQRPYHNFAGQCCCSQICGTPLLLRRSCATQRGRAVLAVCARTKGFAMAASARCGRALLQHAAPAGKKERQTRSICAPGTDPPRSTRVTTRC